MACSNQLILLSSLGVSFWVIDKLGLWQGYMQKKKLKSVS